MNMRMNGNDSTAAWRLLRWLFRTLSSSSSSGDIQSMLLSNRHSWAVHWVCGAEGVEISSKPPEILARKLIIGTFRRMTMAGKTVFWFLDFLACAPVPQHSRVDSQIGFSWLNWARAIDAKGDENFPEIFYQSTISCRAPLDIQMLYGKQLLFAFLLLIRRFLFSPFPNFLFLLLRGENNKPKVDVEEKTRGNSTFNWVISLCRINFLFNVFID